MKTAAKCRAVKIKDNMLNKGLTLEVNSEFYPSLSFFRYCGQKRLSIVFKLPQLINIRVWSRTLMDSLIGHYL